MTGMPSAMPWAMIMRFLFGDELGEGSSEYELTEAYLDRDLP